MSCNVLHIVRGEKNKEASKTHGLEETFKKANKSGDGFLKPEEWLEYLQENGGNATRADVDKVFEEKDKDHNGVLTFREFVGQTSKNELAFKAFDKDGDGFLTEAEFRQACPNLSEAQVKAAFIKFDTNKDGKLDYREFCVMMNAKRSLRRKPKS